MFVQIHMLQSMPPGNLNRDDTGQPKRCIFGRVTRARISSQCLKQNIRKYFKGVFGDALAVRTTYLPRMVADELRKIDPALPEDELNKIKAVLATKFKKADNPPPQEDAEENNENQEQTPNASAPEGTTDQTGQLVFFPPPFAQEVAKLIANLMKNKVDAYRAWVDGTMEKTKKTKKESPEEKEAKKKLKKKLEEFEKEVTERSKSLTVDIGMFGRMTTSDLVVNVEAACQVAHAISTHEAIIESDWFTAMDDRKVGVGAGYIGSGEQKTFFDSAVYYKYLNLDVNALKKHLPWQDDELARAAGALLRAAVCANPTGKQNSFAAHGIPELILVEVSKAKCPISYANAFLKAVEGADLMAESAKALGGYVDNVAKAFSPADMRRVLLGVGSASVDMGGANRVDSLDALVDSVAGFVKKGDAA